MYAYSPSFEQFISGSINVYEATKITFKFLTCD